MLSGLVVWFARPTLLHYLLTKMTFRISRKDLRVQSWKHAFIIGCGATVIYYDCVAASYSEDHLVLLFGGDRRNDKIKIYLIL